MIRLTEFLRLNEAKQVDLLYQEAVYMGKQKEPHAISVLYQLNGFYVEIRYAKYRWHISRISAFESIDRLDPYLPFVDVEELINC